jgi:hypothetical protein
MPSALIGSHLSYFEYLAKQKKRKPEEKQYIPVGEVFVRTLDALSGRENINWDDEEKEVLVRSWSAMKAWEDAAQGLAKLRTKYIVYVSLTSTLGHHHLRVLELHPHQWYDKDNDRRGMVDGLPVVSAVSFDQPA